MRYGISSDVFLSGGDLLRCLQSGSHYNIYLLDIEMPGQNGIEIASVIREQDRDAIIIFITDHKEYVYEVFEVLPFRFLRKPVTAQKLSRILLDAAEHIQVSKRLFFFRSDMTNTSFAAVTFFILRGQEEK